MDRKDAVSTFLEILQRALDEADPVAVYSDGSSVNDYDVGFVLQVGSSHLILSAITSKGEPDGRRFIRLEDVHRIDSKTSYLGKLRLLHEYKDAVFVSEPLLVGDLSDMHAMLEAAKLSGSIVSLLDDEGYGPSGFVREVASDYVALQRINSKGSPDGVAVMMLEAIARLTMDTREEQVLGFLYRYHFELQRMIDN